MIPAWFIMHSAAPLSGRLQKLLDKCWLCFVKIYTGVQVVPAFNSETRNQERMNETFQNYAGTSI